MVVLVFHCIQAFLGIWLARGLRSLTGLRSSSLTVEKSKRAMQARRFRESEADRVLAVSILSRDILKSNFKDGFVGHFRCV